MDGFGLDNLRRMVDTGVNDERRDTNENVKRTGTAVPTSIRLSICILALRVVLIFAALFSNRLPAYSDESLPPLKSGPAIGSDVTSFYVRAITGPLAGKSVCYVCRNGDRPVVMVFLRELGTDATRLLKRLDKTVNEHRADGLRCFVVLLSESARKDAAQLQTLAFDEKIDLPLTMAGESMTGPNLGNITQEAAITVVMYDNLKVTERFSYRTGECNDSACKSVIIAAEAMTKPPSERKVSVTPNERGVSAP